MCIKYKNDVNGVANHKGMASITRQNDFKFTICWYVLPFDWHTYAALLLFCRMCKLIVSFEMRKLKRLHLYTYFTYIKFIRFSAYFFLSHYTRESCPPSYCSWVKYSQLIPAVFTWPTVMVLEGVRVISARIISAIQN